MGNNTIIKPFHQWVEILKLAPQIHPNNNVRGFARLQAAGLTQITFLSRHRWKQTDPIKFEITDHKKLAMAIIKYGIDISGK